MPDQNQINSENDMNQNTNINQDISMNLNTNTYQDQNQNIYTNSNNNITQIDPKHYISPEDNKKANILSGISLGCMFLPMLFGILQNAVNSYVSSVTDQPGLDLGELNESVRGMMSLNSLLSSLSGLAFIAAIVLIIIVRVKYPANTFGKVLMWIYIVFGIIAMILIAIAAIACAIACRECFDSCEDCGSIGLILIRHWSGIL